MSFLQFLTSVTLLVRIFPSHHWKGKTSQGVFGAGCFCNILIFQVDVFQIHFLFSWGGQESHKAHYYFSRTWKTITMLIKKSPRQGMVTVQENKGQKKQMNRYNLLWGKLRGHYSCREPKSRWFWNNSFIFSFPIYKSDIYTHIWSKYKNYKRENKAGATYKNFSCVTITPERTTIMGNFYLKVFCLHVTCGKTVSGRGSGWLQGNSIWGAQ